MFNSTIVAMIITANFVEAQDDIFLGRLASWRPGSIVNNLLSEASVSDPVVRPQLRTTTTSTTIKPVDVLTTLSSDNSVLRTASSRSQTSSGVSTEPALLTTDEPLMTTFDDY
eukprot:GHVH01009789.1.p1 GENE.GHVH01009789.1~~GHVH01009789.1.p1  ORF type:complete len:113 (-),score=17.10 GHVH01009789.1:143-481(-)